jgi:hypothetical protein
MNDESVLVLFFFLFSIQKPMTLMKKMTIHLNLKDHQIEYLTRSQVRAGASGLLDISQNRNKLKLENKDLLD